MQLKNLYPKIGILGVATLMALAACSDDNADIPLINNPDISQQNPQPGVTEPSTDSTTTPAIQDSTGTPADSGKVVTPGDSGAVVPPTNLPAEGPITLPQGIGVLVDDFEDGDGVSKTGDGWYTYDDQDNSGASVITTPINDEKYPIAAPVNNGSNYAFKVVYSLDKGDYEFDPYVGWGMQVSPDDANGRFGGITYWYKGGAHEVHIEVTDVLDFDVHLAKIPASRTWKQAVVRFKDLVQGGWGEEVEFDAKHIMAITSIVFSAFSSKATSSISEIFFFACSRILLLFSSSTSIRSSRSGSPARPTSCWPTG